MLKLGLARHRRTVAVLCWLDVIITSYVFLCVLFTNTKEVRRNDTFALVCTISIFLIASSIAATGLHSLRHENRILMITYGIMLTMKIALQIFILPVMLYFHGIPQPYSTIAFVVIIGVQIYGVVSAYRLTGVFRRGSIQQATKLGIC